MNRSLVRCAFVAAAVALLSVAVPVQVRAASVDPCALVPGNLVTALTGAPATADLHKGPPSGRYAQDTCHYPGPMAKMFVVAAHADSAPFASLPLTGQFKPLAGINGANAMWWAGAATIAMLKNGHYVTMSFQGDMNKPQPSPGFMAAARAAASKL